MFYGSSFRGKRMKIGRRPRKRVRRVDNNHRPVRWQTEREGEEDFTASFPTGFFFFTRVAQRPCQDYRKRAR